LFCNYQLLGGFHISDLLLSSTDRAHLVRLVGSRVRQLVWDINAIYFVGDNGVLNVTADIRTPPSPTPHVFDEAACLTVGTETQARRFRDEGEYGYVYRVVATDVLVERVEIVRTGIVMPGEEVWALTAPAPPDSIVTPCDCGILITTPFGVLPAVQTENVYGFMNWVELRLYERAEVALVLGEHYEIITL